MTNPITFHSQSERPRNLVEKKAADKKEFDKDAVRLINIRPYSNPTLFWIGNVEDDILAFGSRLGFDNKFYIKNDLSILLHAKAVIIRNHEISAIIIGFVKNYDIPLIWFGEKDVPNQYVQSFNLIIKYDSFEKFYGELCKIAT